MIFTVVILVNLITNSIAFSIQYKSLLPRFITSTRLEAITSTTPTTTEAADKPYSFVQDDLR